MDDLSRFCRLNKDCPEHGKRGAGNLTVPHRYGPDMDLTSPNASSVAAPARPAPPNAKVESVSEHVAEGCGVRQTGRLCRVAANTAARSSRLAGEHAKAAHDELVAISPSPPRSSLTRSGPMSARRKPIAIVATRPTTPRETSGIMSPWMRKAAWSFAWSPEPGRSKTPKRWSKRLIAGPEVGC